MNTTIYFLCSFAMIISWCVFWLEYIKKTLDKLTRNKFVYEVIQILVGCAFYFLYRLNLYSEATAILSLLHTLDAMKSLEFYVPKIWLETFAFGLTFIAFLSSTDFVTGLICRIAGIMIVPSFICAVYKKPLFDSSWWIHFLEAIICCCWYLFDYKLGTQNLIQPATIALIYFGLLVCGSPRFWERKRDCVLWNFGILIVCLYHLNFVDAYLSLRVFPCAIILIRLFKDNHPRTDYLLVGLAALCLFGLLGNQYVQEKYK